MNLATRVQSHIERVRHQLAEQVGRPEDRGRPFATLRYLLRLGLQIGRQWARDKCPQVAGSLAYETALSIVPLIAVAFALLKATGAFDERSALMSFLSEQILPMQRADLAAKLTSFADNIGVGALGASGVVSMLALGYLLFHTVEHIYNDIWRVEKRRPLASKLMVFYATTTLVPFLMGISLAHTLPIWNNSHAITFVIPLAATVGALTLQNKLLPYTEVRWRPALAGGVVSGALLEAAKLGFRYYVAHVAFARYSGVYGPLGLVALLLIWIYLCWLIVLLGAEVAHSAQNLAKLEALRPTAELVSGPIAARILVLLAGARRAGANGCSSDYLGEQLGVPAHAVMAMLTRLHRADLIHRTLGSGAWDLAREPGAIAVHEVLELFYPADLAAATAGTRLDLLLAELRESQRMLAHRVSLDDLLGAPPLADHSGDA